YPEGDPFRDLLTAMTESGNRPGEAIKVTAADVDFELGVWVIKGKTTRRTGKDRVVYMNTTLIEVTRRLAAKNPSGPIFRYEDGNPWTLQAINCRFRRKKVRKSDRLDGNVTAYVYRHSFATDALEKGVPDATVAELMGHSGTAILHKHYSKLREKREHLRKAAEQATKRLP
ncbi:tyrosine-type recombinase/integrase, partial [Singulisphaera rosea]